MTPERALVLDFGGVISKTPFETHPQSEQALGLEPGSLTWRGPFDPGSDELWRQMQNDEISERDYWLTRTRQVGELVGEQWKHMSEFTRAVRGDLDDSMFRPEARALIDEVRQSEAKLAILSNELDLFYGAGFSSRCELLVGFDAVVDATYTKILKPDVNAYLNCANELAVAPSECVFVDDQLRNIRGAEQAGMIAVHLDVTRPGEGFERARQLLREKNSGND